MWNTCPKCGRTTDGNKDFCSYCGHALTIKCVCGTKWRYYLDYRFCPRCGKKVDEVLRINDQALNATDQKKQRTVHNKV